MWPTHGGAVLPPSGTLRRASHCGTTLLLSLRGVVHRWPWGRCPACTGGGGGGGRCCCGDSWAGAGGRGSSPGAPAAGWAGPSAALNPQSRGGGLGDGPWGDANVCRQLLSGQQRPRVLSQPRPPSCWGRSGGEGERGTGSQLRASWSFPSRRDLVSGSLKLLERLPRADKSLWYAYSYPTGGPEGCSHTRCPRWGLRRTGGPCPRSAPRLKLPPPNLAGITKSPRVSGPACDATA